MANVNTKKGVIGILTGGGDVPGLNPAIRGVTLRAIREGYQVIGIRHGWAGLVDMVREKDYDNSDNYFLLDEEIVDRAGRTRGTFLHSPVAASGPARPGSPARARSQYPPRSRRRPSVASSGKVNQNGTTPPSSARRPPAKLAAATPSFSFPKAPCSKAAKWSSKAKPPMP